MNGINRIFILGHLGSEPKINSAKNGHVYANLSIATHRIFQKEDQKKTITDWHNVRVWGKQAELCTKYLCTGQAVFVEGYMSSYQKPKPDGGTERQLSIQAIRVDFLKRGEKLDPSDTVTVDELTDMDFEEKEAP